MRNAHFAQCGETQKLCKLAASDIGSSLHFDRARREVTWKAAQDILKDLVRNFKTGEKAIYCQLCNNHKRSRRGAVGGERISAAIHGRRDERFGEQEESGKEEYQDKEN